jgi:hypothetical protein
LRIDGEATLEAFTTASGTALSAAFAGLLGLLPPVTEVKIESRPGP